MARTFQALELFGDLTVRENLLVASERSSIFGEVRDLVWPAGPLLSTGAQLAIEQFALADILDRLPGELSYGRRRLVSIARALARDPSVLLLDEPAAGLSEHERDELSSLITGLVAGGQVGVLLVEHDVELVMRTCSQVVALEFGQVIAAAPPAQIRRDPAVIRSYLGGSPDEPHDALAANEPGDIQSARLS
jgi:sulfate-transporting ATPase